MTEHTMIWGAMGLWIYESLGLLMFPRTPGDIWPYRGIGFGLCMTEDDGDLIVCALMSWACATCDYEAFDELERKWRD